MNVGTSQLPILKSLRHMTESTCLITLLSSVLLHMCSECIVCTLRRGISCAPTSECSPLFLKVASELFFVLGLLIPVLKIPSEYVLIFSWIYMSPSVAANQI